MAASEIPPQMANFQTFSLKDLFSSQGDFFTLCTLLFCVKFQPFSQKAAHFGIEKHPKLQFSAQCTVGLLSKGGQQLISQSPPNCLKLSGMTPGYY